MDNIKLGLWEDFRNKIKHHLEVDNISNFFQWHIIQHTMIANVNDIEYNYLLKHNWDKWITKISENKLQPNQHDRLSGSSTNNLHHAYSLQILMDNLGIELQEFDEVIEFGGGYGNMCRLFKRWGQKENYYIYDIPELTQIQRYYLNQNVVENVEFKNGFDKIHLTTKNTLFIGMWSLTEVPISERAILLENLEFYNCKSIFLGLVDKFIEENNITWLNEQVIPRLNDLGYTCKIIEIQHMPGMHYFLANR